MRGEQMLQHLVILKIRWFPVKVVADLIADSGQFWIDGSLIHKWQYSKGTFGTPVIAKTLDGT